MIFGSFASIFGLAARGAFFAFSSLALLAACGGESESSSSSTSSSSSSSSSTTSSSSGGGGAGGGMASTGDIEVTVIYPMGMHMITDKDVLLVAAFPAGKPPTVPVVYYTLKTDAAAMTTLAFPTTGTLKDVPLGSYDVLALLDIDGNNPTVPGPEDLMEQAPGPIDIKGGDFWQVGLTLKDK